MHSHSAPHIALCTKEIERVGAFELQELRKRFGASCRGKDRSAHVLEASANLGHIFLKTELEGLIKFIEHEYAAGHQVDIPALGVVKEATGGSHHYFGHYTKGILLIFNLMAAVESHRLEAGSNRADHSRNLENQLAARSDHHALHPPGRSFHQLKHRQHECQGLSGACRREKNDISSFRGALHHLLLHRVKLLNAKTPAHKRQKLFLFHLITTL